MAQMVSNLKMHLVVNTQPFPSRRWIMGIKVLAFVAWLFSMKLTIGLEPEFVIGTIEPATTRP